MNINELIEKHTEEMEYPTDSYRILVRRAFIELLENVRELGGTLADEHYGTRGGSCHAEGKSAAIDKTLEELRK